MKDNYLSNLSYKNKHFPIYLCSILVFLIYLPFFFQKAFMLDKNIIIEPLRKVHSISEYYDAFLSGLILDIQPIRDFSHKLDLIIINYTGFENFPLLINLIIFTLCIINLNYIFKAWFNKEISIFLTCLFIVHPSIFFIFIEFTSRKHILSFLFFLLSFKYYLSGFHTNKKKRRLSFLYYSLGCFTQPINFLMPLLFVFMDFTRNKLNLNTLKNYIPMVLILLFTGIINLYYFKVIFAEIHGIQRTQVTLTFTQFTYIIGLFVRQFFLPINYSLFYIMHSASIIIALLCFPIVLLFAKKIDKKITMTSLIIIFIIIFILYGQGTHIIYLNTYLLTPFIGFSILIGLIIKNISLKKLYPFLLIPLIMTFHFSKKRTNELSFYEYAIESEPNCRLLQLVTLEAIKFGTFKKLHKYGSMWVTNECFVSTKGTEFIPDFIRTFLILNSHDFTIDEKIKLFEKRLSYENDLIYIKVFLYLKTNPKKALQELDKLDVKSSLSILMDSKSHLSRDLQLFCSDKMTIIACKKLMKHIDYNQGKKMVFRLKKIQGKI